MTPGELRKRRKAKKNGEIPIDTDREAEVTEAELVIENKLAKIDGLDLVYDFKRSMTETLERMEKYLKEQDVLLDGSEELDFNKVMRLLKANNDFLAQHIGIMKMGLIKYSIDNAEPDDIIVRIAKE